MPFSRLNSLDPDGLWRWMDVLRDKGVDSLAIPHNSNGSNGMMFAFNDWAGNPVDQDYVKRRARNEPLVEITQAKASETHPFLSPNDEWADFEIFPFRTATRINSEPPGSYVRDAWHRGLALAEKARAILINLALLAPAIRIQPLRLWRRIIISAKSDRLMTLLKNAARFRQAFYMALWSNLVRRRWSKKWMARDILISPAINIGVLRALPASGRKKIHGKRFLQPCSARKHSPPAARALARLFAGYDFADMRLNQPDLVKTAYQKGVPMGGNLSANDGRQPLFLAWATADPNTSKLQRIQIIKGWLDNGEHKEQVYDIACSDGLKPDPQTHRCPDNGARVNLDDCSISGDKGAGELKTFWRDPDFKLGQEAFYLRAGKSGLPLVDLGCLAVNVKPRSDLPTTIQERAWSSPSGLSKQKMVTGS